LVHAFKTQAQKTPYFKNERNKTILKTQQTLPYFVALAISTILYVWYAFVSDVDISHSVLAFHREQAFTTGGWQWLSAHFMHNNFMHYLFNMVGLVLLWLLHGEYTNYKSFCFNFLFISLGVSLCIYLFSPNILWYVGMSGVLHGIFSWGVVVDIYYKRKTAYLLLIGLLIKLADEQWYGSSNLMADLIGVGVAVNAHLYGAIFGLISGLFAILALKKRNTN
jgi:rhomboid family GlyGly-CTERM serine protease